MQQNNTIKELTFRLLRPSDCSELSNCLKVNRSVKHLCIQCESRVPEENIFASEESDTPSTNHSVQGYSYVLSQNTSVTSYTLNGYLDICPHLILGLISNRTLTKLVLENVEVNRQSLHVWNEVLRNNSYITELEIKRGFNSVTAMTIFTALRSNRHIQNLKIRECTFYEGGFMALKDLLTANQGIKTIEIRDLIQMAINTHDQELALNNFLHMVGALTDNCFIENASFFIYHNSASKLPSIFLGEKVQNALEELVRINRTLKCLRIEGFRIGGSEICSIFSALRYNEGLKALVLTGNSIEWKDLAMIIRYLAEASYAGEVDISENQIHSYSDLKSLKGITHANESMNYMKEVFAEIPKIKVTKLTIVQWFWEERNYPDCMNQLIATAKSACFIYFNSIH